jgi:hypothetical protein
MYSEECEFEQESHRYNSHVHVLIHIINKIQILGDSHARGLANELKYKLTCDYEIQAVTKPGSTLVNLVNNTSSDLKTLIKSDVCIVWGGPNEVGRNEGNIGIRALKHFISSHKHTDLFVLSVPQRHDHVPNSCVNNEAEVFIKTLVKLKKSFPNLSVINVDDRDLYTRCGLHLNAHGKGTGSK